MSVTQRFHGARVTVMGFGLFGGGASTARWLMDAGAQVTITDLRTAEELAPALETWEADPPNGTAPVWVLGEHREEDFTAADWVVANPAVAPDLYAARRDLVDALLTGVRADPRRYLERTVYLDMLECSEAGVWLLDTETGRVWSLHQFGRC